MESLQHNGILVLELPSARGLSIIARGQEIALSQLQEEMAIAWVKKIGTPYVEDPVFANNFMDDFSRALQIKPSLRVEDVDFSEVVDVVERERTVKAAMTKEEKKAARESRKAERERLKEIFGYALVDGERMELGNYQTEPSGIFMGRGKHPFRGRWKRGVTHKDITLNLSPDASIPEGHWKAIEWSHDSMWIAKWMDELTSKVKYIWLHDSTPIKQEREAAKFDKALRMGRLTETIRDHIMEGLRSDKPKRRMVAAACYLIEYLSLRVGDEKDPDEADTVGATTLRAEHLTFNSDSIVFDFLGKDSVSWHKELEVPSEVYDVFRELYDGAVERVESISSRAGGRTSADPKKLAQLFPSIRSTHVNKFLSEVDPDLTAKMFRTHHATKLMQEELTRSRTKRTDPDFIKKEAFKLANLEVARVMNHTKQAPKGWNRTAERYRERLKKADIRIEKAKAQLVVKRRRLRKVSRKEKALRTKKQDLVTRQKQIVEKNKASVAMWREKRDKAKITWDNARDRKRRTRGSKRKGMTTKKERLEGAQASIERARDRLEKAEIGLANARERYRKSKANLERKQNVLTKFREKSTERVARVERTVTAAKERVKKAELAKKKIQIDYALAGNCRTWNLGTSLKSYIHPKTVYKWCQRVEYDWRKVYPTTLQRKFTWVER
ncbi:MAG: DNA topoisomerase I [Candidatus Thorarchaeota archaeon]